jgi:GNAT superfamily N-acetyltransferase
MSLQPGDGAVDPYLLGSVHYRRCWDTKPDGNNPRMRIDYLADHPDLADDLVALHFAEWGHLHPHETLEQRTLRLTSAAGRGGVPTVVVALKDGVLLGSAMLIASDMDTRLDLTPWLAGVYVVDAARGRGTGSALVRRIETEAAALGLGRLYLYTPDAMEFYARLGWSADERCSYLGQDVTIMSKSP